MNRRPHFNARKFMSASHRLVIALGLTATLLVAPGYSKEAKTPAPYMFFPPPPDEPRVQFLVSFSSDDQLAEMAGKRNFFRFIVGQGKIEHLIGKPYGITSGPGKIYVCDTLSASIAIADLPTKKLKFFQPGGDATFGMPINIAVDSDGTRYVTDTKRKQVLVYKEDTYAGAIGKKDEMKPVGIALAKGRIYVTDMQNHCVRVYDKADRKELFTFPKPGDDKAAQLFAPTNVAIDPQGRVRVSDTGGFFVNSYDADGKYLSTLGGQGLAPGKFSLPKGVAVDHENRTYVVDANTQFIQLFDAEGRILMYFGDPSSNGGGATCLPAGIAVDYENVQQFQSFAAPGFTLEYLILVTNQSGPQKVSVFGFGHKK